jgi:MFS family permease
LITNYVELLLTFGVLMSFGSAFVVISGSVLAIRWFIQKRRLAVGIMASGSGVGTLVVPIFAEFLITAYSWRLAFVIVDAAFFAILLIVAFVMQSPEDRGDKPLGQELNPEKFEISENYTTKQAISTLNFWEIFIIFFLGMIGVSLFLVHIVPFVYSFGISEATASYSIAFLGIGSICARILMGLISDRFRLGSTVVVDFALEAVGILVLSVFGSNVSVLYFSGFFIGLGFGGFLVDFISLTGTLFGMKWMHRSWPIYEFAYGGGGFLGPLIGGFYFDKFGTYSGMFLVATIPTVAALMISILFTHRNIGFDSKKVKPET